MPKHDVICYAVMDPMTMRLVSARVAPLLHRGVPRPCPYLRGRLAVTEGFGVRRIRADVYQHLMDLAFRRSGCFVYRMACEGCAECVPLRVPVDSFVPSRSQRRVWRRNQDLRVEIGAPRPSRRKLNIYRAYLQYQHDGTMRGTRREFEAFLYADATDSLEFVYRAGSRIVGVGIVDVCPDCLSSVYFYFDPTDARRSLGTYSILYEIAECTRRGLRYWYAGYYVHGCAKMRYKGDFRPFELCHAPDGWQQHDAPPS